MLALLPYLWCALLVVTSDAFYLGPRAFVPNSSLPLKLGACAIGCIANLLRDAESKYGCTDLSPLCICKNEHRDFFYGIRDCSLQACGPVVSQKVTDWYYDGLGCDRSSFTTPSANIPASSGSAATKSPTAPAAASSWLIPSSLPSISTVLTSSVVAVPQATQMGAFPTEQVPYPSSEIPVIEAPVSTQGPGVWNGLPSQDPFALAPPPDVDVDGLGSVGAEWLDGPGPGPIAPVVPLPASINMKA